MKCVEWRQRGKPFDTAIVQTRDVFALHKKWTSRRSASTTARCNPPFLQNLLTNFSIHYNLSSSVSSSLDFLHLHNSPVFLAGTWEEQETTHSFLGLSFISLKVRPQSPLSSSSSILHSPVSTTNPSNNRHHCHPSDDYSHYQWWSYQNTNETMMRKMKRQTIFWPKTWSSNVSMFLAFLLA